MVFVFKMFIIILIGSCTFSFALKIVLQQLFEGSYKEGGIELVLNLNKGAVKILDSRRPQEPVKPYPYYEEEVIFKNTEANIFSNGFKRNFKLDFKKNLNNIKSTLLV
jgi:hypothetical protein